MDVNRVYKIVQIALNKNQQGYASPEDFFTIINTAQQQYFDYLLGEYQKYQTQRPIAVVSFGENERIRTSLAPLIYGSVLSINNVTGISPFPSDFEVVDAMWGLYGHYNIKFIQQDRLEKYYHSVIDPIQTNPVYLLKQEGFQFYPENLGSARMSYVRTPPSIVWGNLPDSNGTPTYNPATSQDPVWGDADIMQVIVRALLLFGVNLQLNDVMKYADEIKQTGQ